MWAECAVCDVCLCVLYDWHMWGCERVVVVVYMSVKTRVMIVKYCGAVCKCVDMNMLWCVCFHGLLRITNDAFGFHLPQVVRN